MAKGTPMVADDKKWQAESDLRILKEADEVRKDPKRLKAASDMAVKEVKALKTIGGMGKNKKQFENH